MPKFYQYKGKPAVYQEGVTEPFTSEEAFIKAGGIRTKNRQETQPYWANVEERESALKTPSGLSVGEAEEITAGQKVKSVLYEDLEDRSGTIVNKVTGKSYGEGVTEQEAQANLAADLGVEPHEIDWTKIKPKGADAGAGGAGEGAGVGAGEGVGGDSYQDIVLKAIQDYL